VSQFIRSPQGALEMSVDVTSIDEAKLMEFMVKGVGDVGATVHAATVVLGEELGLYKSLADEGPATSTELAGRLGLDERYVREWLASQAASGYVNYDPERKRFWMTPEQAFALTNEAGPAYLPGAFQLALGTLKAEPRIAKAFRSGEGMAWGEHDSGVHLGCERFFRPSYVGHLLTEWLPALDGVVDKLEAGAEVADIGCGHGASTILMAERFPRSRFIGFDNHAGSIEQARQRAEAAGVADRATFEVASAQDFPGTGYDFAACFDCLHDMGDPVGAAIHVRSTLKPDGTWMVVEPFAGDRLEENLNVVGRVYYSCSTLLCTPASRSEDVGLALGAQAGEAAIRSVLTEAGFSQFRRATETPFNIVYEARP
jgi:SAM-dependent methyltransferase